MALDIACTVLGPVIEPVVQWVAKPIARQFNYLCCFSSNINSLKDEAEKLDDETRGLQMKVNAAKNNAHVILPQVETWLKNSDDIKVEKDRIVGEALNVQSGCLKLKKRFSLSKEAMKKTIAMKELLEQCKFGNDISHPPPIAATAPVPLERMTHVFESRREIEEGIMTTLRGKKVNMIGICGMGGVGKTTMAQKIKNRALEEGLFEEAVMAVVSQPVDKLNIQLQIAEQLGLKLEEETLIPRANKLRTRLREKNKTLIILDDFWSSVNLGELGIPCEDDGRIILSTSRNRDVLTAMNIKMVCELEILNEKESWILFKEKAGTCVDDAKLNPIAKDVMKECKGLPIALATVGMALKDVNDISRWEDARLQLKKSNPSDIPNFIEEVYKPLKLSYDRLDSKNAKSTFLLCCLFGEDENIPVEYLTSFAMGLRLYEDVQELEQVRGRIRTLIEKLKTRCLLLDGSNEDHVRMHDVVRDVSIFIASEKKRIKCDDCTWISTFVDGSARVAPNLNLLFIDNRAEHKIQIDGTLSGGSEKLNVLFVRNDGVLKSLPQTAQLLKSLKTLVLYDCKSLESIPVVGQLESLEILICEGCTRLRNVFSSATAASIKDCILQLQSIQIVGCDEMEQLVLVGNEEDDGNDVGQQSRITLIFPKLKSLHLQFLEKLTSICKGIDSIQFPVLADIRIKGCWSMKCFVVSSSDDDEKEHHYGDNDSLHLFCQPKVSFGNLKKLFVRYNESRNKAWCDQVPSSFFNGLQELYIYDHQKIRSLFSSSIAQNLVNLQKLEIEECGEMVKVIEEEKDDVCSDDHHLSTTKHTTVFPKLEYLCLRWLPKLKSFCEWRSCARLELPSLKRLRIDECPEMKSFISGGSLIITPALQSININGCTRLRNVFSSATAASIKDCILQLQSIQIVRCDEMEQLVLVGNEEDDGNDVGQQSRITLMFPKLKSLRLEFLDKLTSIFKGIDSIQFPVLADIRIISCDALKCFVVSSSDDDEKEHHYGDNDSLHLFCQPKVSFGNLKKLYVWHNESRNKAWCDQVPSSFFNGLQELYICVHQKIRSLFSSSIAQNLVNLQKLEIEECGEMVKVIEEDKEEEKDDVCSDNHHLSTTKHTTVFPKLEYLCLRWLPKLKSFCEWRSCARLELPSLKRLRIDECPEMESFISGGSLIITPALQSININGEDLESGVKDLNAALHQHF